MGRIKHALVEFEEEHYRGLLERYEELKSHNLEDVLEEIKEEFNDFRYELIQNLKDVEMEDTSSIIEGIADPSDIQTIQDFLKQKETFQELIEERDALKEELKKYL